MRMSDKAYEALCETIDSLSYDRNSPEFRAALVRLTEAAEDGNLDAAELPAEIRALPGSHYDPEAAYRWYYVAFSHQGYVMEFNDLNNVPPNYGGVVGDFRNESMVSGLVEVLGFGRVRELDEEAARWLETRNVYKLR